MKKLMISIMLCFLFVPAVNAETLDEYIAKAEATLKKERETSNKRTMSEKEKKDALVRKEQTQAEIKKAETDVKNLEAEIKKLEKQVKQKDKEIKEILEFVQVANGENTYLEYAFGASDFTDFIYRIAVAEQLSSHNDELIDEYNKAIEDSEKKKVELKNKQKELKAKQGELELLISKLSKEIDDLNDSVQSYEAEYKNLMSYVNYMKNKGCKGNESIAACRARLAPKPSYSYGGGGGSATGGGNANGFYMPLTQGRVTSNYGWRDLNGDGRNDDFHNALDISNHEGAPVYPITGGQVRVVSRGNSCGRNIVYIVHNVNGKMYTTVYYHLKSVNVSVNQDVSYSTQIGTQGGNPSYDSCSSGSHLDVKVFRGEYPYDFTSLQNGPHMNPRSWLTQAPAKGKYFSSR